MRGNRRARNVSSLLFWCDCDHIQIGASLPQCHHHCIVASSVKDICARWRTQHHVNSEHRGRQNPDKLRPSTEGLHLVFDTISDLHREWGEIKFARAVIQRGWFTINWDIMCANANAGAVILLRGQGVMLPRVAWMGLDWKINSVHSRL